MTNNYYKNTEVQLTATFQVSGVNTDPTTVTFKVIDPTGSETPYTTPTVIRTGVGAYLLDLLANVAGYWSYRVEGTGTAYAAAEGRFYVRESAF